MKALVAEEVAAGGSVVLNADDPAVAALADRPAVRVHDPVIRFFTQRADNPVTAAHQRAGGLCCEVRDGELVEIEGDQQRPMIGVAELPGAFGGRAAHLVANALAAVAASRAVGISARDIRRGLVTFTPAQANPGRGNVYRAGGRPVILDYGHNAAALEATGAMVAKVWGARRRRPGRCLATAATTWWSRRRRASPRGSVTSSSTRTATGAGGGRARCRS